MLNRAADPRSKQRTQRILKKHCVNSSTTKNSILRLSQSPRMIVMMRFTTLHARVAAAGNNGQARNGVLYIYEEDEGKALETLKHELIDCLITSMSVKPLVELVNLLIKSRESDIYREKETIIEALSKMLV
jgi:hypothetical protein